MLVLALAIGVALLFALTNGFHDSANAIAALVATGAARPLSAVILAATFNILGPLLVGTAVANTVGGIVQLPNDQVLAAVGAALTGAVAWNMITWWRGLPSSSSHALVGGLVGAGVLTGGLDAINWGGLDGIHPVGVFGVFIALAVSPVLGFTGAFVLDRLAVLSLRRARRRVNSTIRRSEWGTAAALSFSHGANDGEKAMGVITLLLVATGHLPTFAVPLWVKLAAAGALTIGTAFGGWRIVRTIGRGIYRLRPLDGLVSQSSSAAVILGAAVVGGPVSTTHVVASSVVGLGTAQRSHHVHWAVVKEMGLAWLITLPAAAALAALALPLWRFIA